MGIRAYQPEWTKNNRKIKNIAQGSLSEQTWNVLKDAEKIARTVYDWEGLDTINATKRYIESLFFWKTCIGIAPQMDGAIEHKLVMGGNPVILNMYDEVYTWIPEPLRMTTAKQHGMKEYHVNEYPCIKIAETSTAQSLLDECTAKGSAIISVNQNVIGMRTPVAVRGVDSSTVVDYITTAVIEGSDTISGGIPVLDGASNIVVEVLDLKATNFIDPLTGIMEYMKAEIQAKLGVDALGTQKASGITEEEASLILRQIAGIRKDGLLERERVCDMINENIEGANVSVDVAEEFKENLVYGEDRAGRYEDSVAPRNTGENGDDEDEG